MAAKEKQFWYLYSALVILVLIRIIPFLYPASRTWGFNHLIFLPQIFSVAFFAVAAIALILPFVKKSEIWGERFVDWFSNTFFESPRHILYRILFISLMAVLFVVFAAPTHFLGDGYILINALSSSMIAAHEWLDVELFKWSEIGATRLVLIVQSILGQPSKQNTILAFQVISVISGILHVWLSFKIASIASQNRFQYIIIMTAALSSGVMLLFFGYIEYYHFIWVFILAYLYFLLKYIKTGEGLIFQCLFLIIGIILHLQMILLFPATIIAVLSTAGGLSFIARNKLIFTTSTVMVCLGILGFICYKYVTDLYIGDMFLALYDGKMFDPTYSIISIPHFIDIANELILVSPLFILIISIKWRSLRFKSIDRRSLCLLASAISSLLFLFSIDPQLEMPRDWDLFSMTPFTAVLLFIILLDEKAVSVMNKIIISVAVIPFISAVPYLVTNINSPTSIRYMEYIAGSKTEKSMPSLMLLYEYYEKHGPKYKLDSISPIFKERFPTNYKRVDAGKAINAGNFDAALKLLNSIEFNQYDAILQRLYGRYYYLIGDYDKATKYVENALQMREYNADNYGDRAKINIALGYYDKAFKDLRHGYKLNNSSKYILDGLANTFFTMQEYDSTIYYAKKRLLIDSSNANYYYLVAESYLKKRDLPNAKAFAVRYAAFNLQEPVYQKKLKELIAEIEKFNK